VIKSEDLNKPTYASVQVDNMMMEGASSAKHAIQSVQRVLQLQIV